MAKVFFFCSALMTFLMIVLVIQRYRLERLKYEAEAMRLAVEERAEEQARSGEVQRRTALGG